VTTSRIPPPAVGQNRSVWHIDSAHSLVEFSIRHMMISTVKGRFTGLTDTILDVADNPAESSVSVQVDAASLTTGDPKRDAHLRSPDFFDVASFPSITFESRRVEGPREKFSVVGDLTIHGQTLPVTLGVTFNGVGTDPYGKTIAAFTADTTINRKDFGLNWNVALETGGVLVSDNLKVQIEVEAVRQDPN
jgi:polyisoprenoid-binding protein YceI